MFIPDGARVNGSVWRKINGQPCYRVRLVGGPAAGTETLTTSTELFAHGARYILQDDGNFVFAEPNEKPPVVT